MRIVGGALSGRRFDAPAGASTRPTSERVREAIASALEARGWIADRNVLDLFAGSGALAFEALSRGARRATLVDSDRSAIRIAERSARTLELAERARVLNVDLASADRLVRAVAGERFDLIFLDPPYVEIERVTSLLEALVAGRHVAPGAVVVIEHARRAPPVLPRGFSEVSTYRYGDTAVLLARAPEELP